MKKPTEEEIKQRNEEQIKMATLFIKSFMMKSNRFNKKYSTYNLKHCAERVINSLRDTGHFYISEKNFKTALIEQNYITKKDGLSDYHIVQFKWDYNHLF